MEKTATTLVSDHPHNSCLLYTSYPADSEVGIFVKPFNIQIMHKPESEDEKAVDINE